jgi:hypothetical protein
MRGGGVGERLEEVAVEFDRGQFADPVEQRNRQRTLARADLDQAIARPRVDGQHDPVDHRAVVQEILAQVFLGARRESGRIHAWRRATHAVRRAG